MTTDNDRQQLQTTRSNGTPPTKAQVSASTARNYDV
jgi:hypothetical protein